MRARVSIGPWILDPELNTVSCDGTIVRLEPKVVEVCVCLADRAGEMVSKDDLLKAVWPDTYVTEDVLVHAVSELRKTFQDSARNPQFIETIPKRGYRLIAPVQRDSQYAITRQTQLPKPRRIRASIWALSVILLAALAVSGASLARVLRKPKPPNATPAKLEPIPLVTYAEGGQWLPAFSPDGSRVAYAWRSPQAQWFLDVKLVGHDERMRLTPDGAGFPPGPAWSPDGTQIAFVRAGDLDDRGIFLISAIGGRVRKLRSMSTWRTPQRMVSWSPDGNFLAFSDSANDPAKAPNKIGPNAIFVLSLATMETRQLTHPADDEIGDAAPAFSPDGRTIAFVHTTPGVRDELSLVPAEGGPVRKLPAPGIWTNGLTWTPDGQSIIFDRSIDGGFALYRISAQGGEPQKLDLPSDRVNLLEPALWKNNLAYEVHENYETMGRIPLNKPYVVAPQFPLSSTRADYSGRYSPHGDRIAFISDRSGNQEVWLSDADGSNPLQLTHLGTHLFDLAWAPDADFIAASNGGGTVFQVTVPTGIARVIFNQHTYLDEKDNIAFSRDGKFVYVISQLGNGAELVKAPVAGGPPIKVLDEIVSQVAESPDGKTLFFGRPISKLSKSRPGIWSRPVDGGPEHYILPFANYWNVGPDGLYVADGNTSKIEKYSFSGKHIQTLTKLGEFDIGHPFTISPDARYALFGYNFHASVEIDLVRAFQ